MFLANFVLQQLHEVGSYHWGEIVHAPDCSRYGVYVVVCTAWWGGGAVTTLKSPLGTPELPGGA